MTCSGWQRIKQLGNAAFNENETGCALDLYYGAALAALNLRLSGEVKGQRGGWRCIPTERVAELRRLRQSIHLNRAVCLLKSGDWKGCVDACSVSMLEGGEANLKALYRRGQALYKLGRLQEATQDLAMAVAMEPKDIGIQQLLATVRQAYADQVESSFLEDGEYDEDR